jgi:serine/threonine-protein kinase
MKPPSIDRQTFLENLRKSGVLTPRELQAVLPDLPETDRARVVARALVQKGVLTKFQAELLLIGRTGGFVLGQYCILDNIGKGGMGRVYKAMHRTMKRVVALKVLAPELVKTEKARRLFKREVQAAARLLHPNIVTAYDANKVGNRYYLVMEYVDGPNLDQLVRVKGPLPVSLACEFVRQAALGLQHAHEMGMVHRDIKPANLLVQRPPAGSASAAATIKILDFGLARLHEAAEVGPGGAATIHTAPNTVLGTPDYLSPEQSRDLHTADIRSDLYSLGCTLYFLLTGRAPFAGGSSLEKLIRHAREEPPRVEKLRPEVPPAVARIVRRLLAKEPALRYETPAELAAALAPLAAAGPVTGLPPARTAPPRPAPDLPSDPDLGEVGLPGEAEAPAGLEGTWPPAFGPTSVAEGSSSVRRRGRHGAGPGRRATLLFWVATAAVALGAALALFFALH